MLELNGIRIQPDRYCPKGKAFGLPAGHVVPPMYGVAPGESLGDAVITAVDHRAGTITADSSIVSRIQHLVQRMARENVKPDTVIMSPDNYAQLVDALRDVPADAYEYRMQTYAQLQARAPGYAGTIVLGDASTERLIAGIAATCAIAGLGLLIARRNAVMAEEGPSESWLKAFVEWACEFVRALFAPPLPALPAYEDSDAA